jgi:hypothetical protein
LIAYRLQLIILQVCHNKVFLNISLTDECVLSGLLLLLLFLARAVTLALSIEVATFQETGLFSTNSYLKSNTRIPSNLEDFTLCFRVKLFRLRGVLNFAVSYAHEITANALLAGWYMKNVWAVRMMADV